MALGFGTAIVTGGVQISTEQAPFGALWGPAFASRRVLVTGGAGFVGLPLVGRLLAAGARVVILDDFSVRSRERLGPLAAHLGLRIEAADLTDAAAVTRVVARAQPELCVHLAAIHSIPRCRAEPATTIATNVLGTQRLIDALTLHARGCRVLLASTADVYKQTDGPHREDSGTQPNNVYGLSKLSCESLLKFAGADGAIDPIVARFFNIYGPGDTNPHLLPDICVQLAKGRTLALGNLLPRRDFVFVDDIADAVIGLLAVAPSGAVVNVGTGKSWSVRDLIELIERIIGQPITIEADPDRMRSVDRSDLVADTGFLQRLLPGACATPFEEGLRILLADEGLIASPEVPAEAPG
jgi:UDP-glucose 4-epimerase